MNTDKLEIRKYLPEHYAKTVEWLNQKELRKLFGLTYDISIESHAKWVESSSQLEFLPLFSNDIYIGNIVLNFTPRHRSAYLQIYIGEKDFTGKGLGEKFMIMAHDYVFNKKKYNRIWLHIREHNVVAQNLYQKLGYVREGLERQSIFEDNVFHNQVVMSLLADDFNKK